MEHYFLTHTAECGVTVLQKEKKPSSLKQPHIDFNINSKVEYLHTSAE